MSSVGEHGSDGPNLDKAREMETEKILVNLINSGLLDISKEDDMTNQMSDQAMSMGRNIQRRFLEKLNIDTLGKYIKEIRKAKTLDEGEVSKYIKIARETFIQLERDQMKFSDLSLQKAVNLFKFLDLNLQIVIDFLRSSVNISNNLSSYSSFYRTKSPLTEQDKEDMMSLDNSISTSDDKKNVEKFIEDLKNELQKQNQK